MIPCRRVVELQLCFVERHATWEKSDAPFLAKQIPCPIVNHDSDAMTSEGHLRPHVMPFWLVILIIEKVPNFDRNVKAERSVVFVGTLQKPYEIIFSTVLVASDCEAAL
jgi:hypothetical protein